MGPLHAGLGRLAGLGGLGLGQTWDLRPRSAKTYGPVVEKRLSLLLREEFTLSHQAFFDINNNCTHFNANFGFFREEAYFERAEIQAKSTVINP